MVTLTVRRAHLVLNTPWYITSSVMTVLQNIASCLLHQTIGGQKRFFSRNKPKSESNPMGQDGALQEKAARRATLRNEYWRTMTNPHNHLRGESGGVFDTGLARFQAMRVNHFEHFKPTGRSFKIGMLTVVLPIIVYAKMMKYERDQREQQYRTGQVAYKDRRFKFI